MFPSVGKQQQMCGVSTIVSHVLYGDLPDRCDLSVAWGKNTSPLRHSHPPHSYKTCTAPRTRSAVCSQFPALTFCFRCFAFSELCGDNSRSLSLPPSLHPSRDTTRWQHPSPINHHISSADWCLRTRSLKLKSHSFPEIGFETLYVYVCMCIFALDLAYHTNQCFFYPPDTHFNTCKHASHMHVHTHTTAIPSVLVT